MNITANLGRAQVMRAVAGWLEKNPGLPIDDLRVSVDGRVRVSPGDGDTVRASTRAAALFALADAVNAPVTFTGRKYGGGWELAAEWSVGVVPVRAEVDIYEAAINVRPIETDASTATA
jgi:hypothetical protein